MIETILAIGSNCGDKEANVDAAVSWLHGAAKVETVSSFYSSPDIKGTGHTYLNAVVKALYVGSVEEFNSLIKNYEKQAGRDEECRSRGLVPIDIDIVIAEGVVLRPKDYRAEYFIKGFKECQRLS